MSKNKKTNKIKLFQEPTNGNEDVDGGTLERKTNKWLAEHPDINIKSITPASFATKGWLCIWYKEGKQ